jgi:hypothetical protein
MGNNQGLSGFGNLGSSLLPPDDPRANAPNIFGLVQQMGETNAQIKLMEKDHQHWREVKELQERLEKMEQDKNKATGMSGIVSTIGEQFKDPAVLMGLLGNLKGLFEKSPAPQTAPPVRPMAGVDADVESNVENSKNELVSSVNSLLELDPNFTKHISILAGVAKNKPELYKAAIDTLISL